MTVEKERSMSCISHKSVPTRAKPRTLSPAGGFEDSSIRLYALDRAAGAAGGGGAAAAAGVSHLRGHSAAVYGVDYSADGQLLFSASGDGCVRCSR